MKFRVDFELKILCLHVYQKVRKGQMKFSYLSTKKPVIIEETICLIYIIHLLSKSIPKFLNLNLEFFIRANKMKFMLHWKNVFARASIKSAIWKINIVLRSQHYITPFFRSKCMKCIRQRLAIKSNKQQLEKHTFKLICHETVWP